MSGKRIRLTWEQKRAVVLECERRGVINGYRNIQSVCDWAKSSLKLIKKPSYKTVKKIIAEKEKINMKALSTHSNMLKDLHVRSFDIENKMVAWIWLMHHRNIFLNDEVILEKANRIQTRLNDTLPLSQRTYLKFSRGWLARFKKRNRFRRYRSHGESADVDHAAAESELPLLRTLLAAFALKNQFNCDEFSLCYKQAPTTTIGPGRLPGHKKSKDRLTFLACVNADGSERIAPLVIGHAKKPRCFHGQEGWELGFDYHKAKRAWMNRTIFFRWLFRFDSYIGRIPGRRAILILDNCSAHGTVEYLPDLLNVHVLFLPKNTTALLQPLDSGVIASLKKRFKKQQTQRAIDLIELGHTQKLYDCNVITAMQRMYDITERLESSIITNCWKKTGLWEC